MQDFTNKKIVLGICGGIAAYKSAYLVRELSQLGAEIRVVMTHSAKNFITPLTFQALTGHPTRIDLFDEEAERGMGHIELARWADYLLIAPASANCLAKMAQGIADDLLSTLYLVAETPVIVCPAMNRSMWTHQATQANCDVLKKRGVVFVDPEEGAQACGEEGFGRLASTESIINGLRLHAIANTLCNETILITAGPTIEPIDPVRCITNHSSGKMGYALALAARQAGAKVILITGPTSLPLLAGVTTHTVETAVEMHNAVMKTLKKGMIFIGAAAVSDYKIASQVHEKIKKNANHTLTLSLTLNPDIIADVVASKKASFVVGFAAETTKLIHHAKEKMATKQFDMIIANQVGKDLGFNRDDNKVTVLTQHNEMDLPIMHKVRVAGEVIAILKRIIHNAPHAHC